MRGFLCKIFRFALSLFSSVVTVVAEAVKLIGTAAVDVLDDLLEAGGNLLTDILGSPGKLIMFGLLGYGAYLLLSSDEDDSSERRNQREQTLVEGSFNGT